MTVAFSRYWSALLQLWRAVSELWSFALALLGFRRAKQRVEKKVKPWMMVLRRQSAKESKTTATATEADIQRLLERMNGLDDASSLTERAVGFAGQSSDYFADPREVARIIEALIRENPPFLHIARERPAEGEGESRQFATELVLRETEVVVREPVTVFVPRFGVEHMESRRPPGFPVVRAARSLSDLRAVPMLYLSVPEDIVFARLVEGSLPILAYREERKTILFQTEQHIVERRERRRNHVEIEIETGSTGQSTRLMYMLLDRSTSLVHNCAPRGSNAVMELAIAAAMIRSDMGRPHARYYFRAFADGMDPKRMDPPICASTVQEKDGLVHRLMQTNFCGDATRVVDALDQAIEDIERIVESGELGTNVKPRIGLLTDGRFTLYGGIGARLKRAGIELDTVLIGKEAARNPDLIKISSTVSLVDPELYKTAQAA
jgi:hypothetical protein